MSYNLSGTTLLEWRTKVFPIRKKSIQENRKIIHSNIFCSFINLLHLLWLEWISNKQYFWICSKLYLLHIELFERPRQMFVSLILDFNWQFEWDFFLLVTSERAIIITIMIMAVCRSHSSLVFMWTSELERSFCRPIHSIPCRSASCLLGFDFSPIPFRNSIRCADRCSLCI